MIPLTLAIECETVIVSVASGILFSSNPPGAHIYIIATGSGMPVYTELQTPNAIYLPVGSYDYILKLSGYEDYIGTAIVNPNEITSVSVSLTLKTPTSVPISSVLISSPTLVIVGSVSILAIILVTTSEKAVPITTGMLSGKTVAMES